ncbi:glycosyltransferase family 2 protein [Butyrivibrio sp. AE2032]|uniref:glycosyltransferase family 2 protein n=1 Tax=Butyrivibrio sp. AE2032 TaxID=1458463 RepID=UPI00054D39D0|nr:glycosyltransferase family 2 protein [Butyrivibrio sp. AE2032]
MLISIVTPIYNSREFLNECIESVLKQTNPNWELILVDDGSTDGSGEICNVYARKDARIKVIHKENSGQFDSRLCGIKASSGEYCTGLDSDDYLECDCVEKLLEILQEKQYDVVSWDLRIVENKKEIGVNKKRRYGEYSNIDFLEYIISSTDHSFCNKLIKTELLKKAYYGVVPQNVRHSEDYIMICPAICCSENIIAVDETLYNYRQVSESVTHAYYGKRIIDYLDSSLCIRNILEHYSLMLPHLIEEENKALVSPVGDCLKQSYKRETLKKEDVETIRNHPIYKQLAHYEKKQYSTYDIIVFMRMFRYRLDWLIALLYKKKV